MKRLSDEELDAVIAGTGGGMMRTALLELRERRAADLVLTADEVEALHMVRGMIMYVALRGPMQHRMLDVVDRVLDRLTKRSES